jgi:hypothetical protein
MAAVMTMTFGTPVMTCRNAVMAPPVMVARGATTHAFACKKEVVDGRATRDHDGGRWWQA